jgi:NAD(P)-dependent dehydrogenase (short-subunit alcohol dehydrogenase family)
MITTKVALVTGANRGIGLQICRELAKLNIHVILTSRDAEKGAAAVNLIQQEQPQAKINFFALDVTNSQSISAIHNYVINAFGRLDILVNNAAILVDDDMSIFDLNTDQLRATMEANVYGPLRLCQVFIPMMVKNGYGRVVNVSSEMGQLSAMGAGTAAYRISKTALNAVTTIFNAEIHHPNVKINSCCPGWVRTDMGGPSASKSLAEGADTPVWLATLPDNAPSGGFFADRTFIAW